MGCVRDLTPKIDCSRVKDSPRCILSMQSLARSSSLFVGADARDSVSTMDLFVVGWRWGVESSGELRSDTEEELLKAKYNSLCGVLKRRAPASTMV
jgi:hypothetical protein